MFKRLLAGSIVMGFIIAFSVQNGGADDPKWREHQQARFEETGLKPGEVITKADWNRVDGLLPPEILEWVKKDYIELKIGEFKYNPSHDSKWMNDKRNAGKFKLNAKKRLVEVATAKSPLWMWGEPFPDLDIRNDPDGAIKLMYNREINMQRMGSSHWVFTMEWIGDKGFERGLWCHCQYYFYWARPDGQVPNQNRVQYMDTVSCLKPFDLAGTAVMSIRKLDGKGDESYAYIPAIRRTRRLSGANRTDPWMGSNISVDDGCGYAGLIHSMEWKFIEEKTGLISVDDWVAEHTCKMKEVSPGCWKNEPGGDSMRMGWQIEGWKKAKWAPIDVVWIPRTVIVIEAKSLDPYYNYGPTTFWIDKEMYWINYKVISDRAEEYWKTLIQWPRVFEWAESRGVQRGESACLMVDEKLKRATAAHVHGTRQGLKMWIEFNSPEVNRSTFTVERLRMGSK